MQCNIAGRGEWLQWWLVPAQQRTTVEGSGRSTQLNHPLVVVQQKDLATPVMTIATHAKTARALSTIIPPLHTRYSPSLAISGVPARRRRQAWIRHSDHVRLC